MKRIRILLAEIPRMLREIVESVVSAQSDMQIVGAVESCEAIGAAVAAAEADVVIVASPGAISPRSYAAVLFEHPRLMVVAVTSAGREAVLCGLRPYATPIAEVSPTGLVEAIRGAVRAPAV